MEQFIKFEDALEKLGISSERLNDLRENGLLRAYRDGSSWKFRGDEISKMMEEGIPEIPPPSDIGLIDSDQLVDAEPLALDLDDEDDDELQLADESDAEATDIIKKPKSEESEKPSESGLDLEMDDVASDEAGSDISIPQEDTVTASTSDIELDGPPETSSDPSDSILLSEEELGESVGASPSTIIGRKDLDSGDADLELADDDDVMEEDSGKPSSSGASDVHSSNVAGSGVLDDLESGSGGTSAFKDLEELEIDLAAESSLILNPHESAAAKSAAKAPDESKVVDKGDSDLKLDDDVEVGDEANMGSTDVPLSDVGSSPVMTDEGSGSELELTGDDDMIISDSEGSDITLDSGDSGINLVSPSDSGLALDDIPLDAGGSAILSSLSLEGSDPEISLLGGDSKSLQGSGEDLQTDDDFQLTPHTEGDSEDGDSSSQVLALDAEIDDLGGGLDDVDFSEEPDEGVVLGGGEFSEEPAEGIGAATYAPSAAAVAGEPPYTVGNLIGLGACLLLLALGSIMMLDMIRNIWSWEEPYTISSALIDSLLSLFGLGR